MTYHVCDCRVTHKPLQPAVSHHLLSHLHHHRVVQHTSEAISSASSSSWTTTCHTPKHLSHSTEVRSAGSCPRLGRLCGWGFARQLRFFCSCLRIGQGRGQAGISWFDIETALERGGRLSIISQRVVGVTIRNRSPECFVGIALAMGLTPDGGIPSHMMDQPQSPFQRHRRPTNDQPCSSKPQRGSSSKRDS